MHKMISKRELNSRLRIQYNRQLYKDIAAIEIRTGEYQYKLLKRLAKKEKRLKRGKAQNNEFYLSKLWKIKRERILIRDNYTCQECGRKKILHVHHIKYLMFSNKDKDLITLCKYCHAKHHPINGAKILSGC